MLFFGLDGNSVKRLMDGEMRCSEAMLLEKGLLVGRDEDIYGRAWLEHKGIVGTITKCYTLLSWDKGLSSLDAGGGTKGFNIP